MKKISILGGGLAGMTAAFWLTEKPGWEEEYEITVHQLGWRLGGKCASGRELAPGYGHRIYEHGLHIWLGFYDNAFATMRRLLAGVDALDPPPVATFRSLEEAFTSQSLVTLQEQYRGRWVTWPLLFPPNLDPPGRESGHTSHWDLIRGALRWLWNLHDLFPEGDSGAPARVKHHAGSGILDELAGLTQDVESALGRAVIAEKDSLIAWIHGLSQHVDDLPEADQKSAHGVIARALRALRESARTLTLPASQTSVDLHRLFIALDLGCSVLIGILVDGLLWRGFESADGKDFKQWLSDHGAHESTLDSPPVEVIYDLVFGFEDGDPEKYNFAAGTCVRGLLRMLFGYRGTLMYKMEAGMGDTIFTPLYGLLRARGVRFRFFEKVTALELDPTDPDAVGSIRITRQATVKPEIEKQGGYWPLLRVGALDCWPAAPDFDQLVEGELLKHDPDNPGHPYDLESYWSGWEGVGGTVLRRGQDFDHVVLAISIAALPFICKNLIDARPEWQRMVGTDGKGGVETTPTRAVQLWLKKSSEELGWKIPKSAVDQNRDWQRQHGRSLGISALVGSYVDPLNTWADLSHLLVHEDWPATHRPRSLGYWVGPLAVPDRWPPFSDHGFPKRVHDQLLADSMRWFDDNTAVLLPGAATQARPNGLDPGLLVDPERRSGTERYQAQFFRANIDPSERYVLSVKGSTALRIPGAASGFSNLTLAGDWTYNRVLNAGCVEATVASGMEAAQALCGVPAHIPGDDDSARS